MEQDGNKYRMCSGIENGKIVESTWTIVEDEAKLAKLQMEYLHAAGYTTHCLTHGVDLLMAAITLPSYNR